MDAGVEKPEYVIERVEQHTKHRDRSVYISRQALQIHTHTHRRYVEQLA